MSDAPAPAPAPAGAPAAPVPAADPVVIESTDTGVVARLNVKLLDDATVRRADELADKAACGRAGVNYIVLDMSRVQIVPSLGLGALLQLMSKYKERNQRVRLAGVQSQVRTTMAITKLDKVFDLYETVEAATR